jgi:hypothetical protein
VHERLKRFLCYKASVLIDPSYDSLLITNSPLINRKDTPIAPGVVSNQSIASLTSSIFLSISKRVRHRVCLCEQDLAIRARAGKLNKDLPCLLCRKTAILVYDGNRASLIREYLPINGEKRIVASNVIPNQGVNSLTSPIFLSIFKEVRCEDRLLANKVLSVS